MRRVGDVQLVAAEADPDRIFALYPELRATEMLRKPCRGLKRGRKLCHANPAKTDSFSAGMVIELNSIRFTSGTIGLALVEHSSCISASWERR